MVDKEYSLAQNAARFFTNMSHFFDQVKLDPNQIDQALLFSSLTSMDQSEDIFMLNLKSINNLLKSELNSPTMIVDFVRRRFVTIYVNPLLHRSVRQLDALSLMDLSKILRLLAENRQVTNQFSNQINIEGLIDLLKASAQAAPVLRNLFGTLT